MTRCPYCSHPYDGAPGQTSATVQCPDCGRMFVAAAVAEDDVASRTSEVDLASASVLVTSCPRCHTTLASSHSELADARFGKCESCGFVFVLAEGSLAPTSLTDPRVVGARRLIPFRTQPAQKSAEELTGESTNIDSGIKDHGDRVVAMLISDAPPMRVSLSQDATVIGRVKADITIDAADVSRRHAIVERRGTGFVVRDLGSTNGTYVNGQRVEEAPLASGDRIVVGQTVFHFHTSAEGEGVYLVLAMAPVGDAAQSAESHVRCLQAWGVAIGNCFGARERDVLSSPVTGRALAIFPFDEAASESERRQLAACVLRFPHEFAKTLSATRGEGQAVEARVAIALGQAKRVVQEGKSKLTGEIIPRVASLFTAPAPPFGGGIIEEASLHRLLAPAPEEPVGELLATLGYALSSNGDPTKKAVIFFPTPPTEAPAGEHETLPGLALIEELCDKARVGLEAEIATAFSATAGPRKGKLQEKLASVAGGDVRVRSSLYRPILGSPLYLTEPLLLQWLKHLEEGGRMLERFAPIRELYPPSDLATVSAALRLLGAAFHGLPDLRDLDLARMTAAASEYLRTADPDAAADASHPLARVLALFGSVHEEPHDEATPVRLFEFLALLALIRSLRTRGGSADLGKAKALLESLKDYSTIWGQMLREEQKEART